MSEETRRTIPREQDAPRALIAVMIAAMLLSVVGAYVAIDRAGLAEHVLGRPASLATGGLIFTVDDILDEPAKVNLLGRDVAVWGVPVQRVSGDWLFWVGADSTRAVPVILMGEQTGRQTEHQTEVRAGHVVAVFGQVHALRDLILRNDRLATARQDRERLSSAQVYISAVRVEILR